MHKTAQLMIIIVLLVVSFNSSFAQITADEVSKIEEAIPEKAVVNSHQPRRLLVFSLSEGYKHVSIPYAEKMLKIMSKKTKAFEVEISSDMSVFNPEKLSHFDAVCFNNTTQLTFLNPTHRKSLMDFVKSGKGIIGIHAAIANFYNWNEAAEMMGGVFDGHPWTSDGTWKVKITDTSHPLNKAFEGKNFVISDEIYRINQRNLRENSRVILALDMKDKTNLQAKNVQIADRDIPISWVRDFGKGRLFYCSLGHNKSVYWDAPVLQHYLAGIQFALGDYKVNTTPILFDIDNAIQPDEFSRLLDKIKTYQYGQSREYLTKISDLFRQAGQSEKLKIIIEKLYVNFLKSDASLSAKQFISENLSTFASETSLPLLSEMLGNSQTVEMALFVLQRIPTEQTSNILRDALNKTTGKLKIGVINALGNLKDKQAVKQIIPLISENDPELALAGINALGKIAGREATEALEKIIPGLSGKIRDKAIVAYMRCAKYYEDKNNNENALAIYQSLFETGHVYQVRYAALQGILSTSEQKKIDIIIENMKSNNQETRLLAVQLSGEIPDSEDVTSIVKQFPGLSETGQMWLLTALSGRKQNSVRETILNALKSPNEQIRIAALKALQNTGSENAVYVFSNIASNTKGLERQTAREGLYRLNTPSTDMEITELIPAMDDATKIELIRSISKRHILKALPVLKSEMSSKNIQIRIEAAKAMKNISTPNDMDQLLDLLVNARSDKERKELESTIVAVSMRIPENKPRVDNILAKMKVVGDSQTRSSFYKIFAKISDPEALPELRSGLVSKDDLLKTSAIKALSAWQDDEPANDLFLIAQSSLNEQHRVLALRGYFNLAILDANASQDEIAERYIQALPLAKTLDDKRMALSGLARIKSIFALKSLMISLPVRFYLSLK